MVHSPLRSHYTHSIGANHEAIHLPEDRFEGVGSEVQPPARFDTRCILSGSDFEGPGAGDRLGTIADVEFAVDLVEIPFHCAE